MRYFLRLAYNGTGYNGWQKQHNAPTIQQELSEKLSTVLQKELSITGCGRTDAGVHATEFYAHFDVEYRIELEAELLVHKLNTLLPAGIAVYDLLEVNEGAHARFDANRRSYQYLISKRKDPFRPDQTYRFSAPLDLEIMNKACTMLLGEQDFGCFCKSHSNNTTNICTVHHANWTEMNEQLMFEITANRFLRNMVRAIVGTMLDIGQYRTSLSEFKEILASGNRSMAGRSVPAHGLYLTQVEYPSHIFLNNK